jgi:hypothetical protein
MTSKILLIALAICWSAAPSEAWSSLMGPALARPKKNGGTTLKQHVRPLSLVMKADDGGNKNDGDSGFSLANLFSGKGSGSTAATAAAPSLRGFNKALEAHPSVRPHISPLNRLGPDFDAESLKTETEALPVHPDVKSGTLPNGFSYVILPNKSPPGRFEAHLQVFSGSGKYFVSDVSRGRCCSKDG